MAQSLADALMQQQQPQPTGNPEGFGPIPLASMPQALGQAPTLADGWDANANAYKDYVAKQQADLVARGLNDPQTGWPTQAGWLDAAHQIGNSLLMGTTAPGEGATMANPAFAKWFGASKVTKPDGSPTVVYHGTTANVDSFSKASRGSATGATDAKQGFFFTDSPKVAGDFTPIVRDGDMERTTSAPGSNIMPVHLKMENPAEWDWGGGVSDSKGMMEAIKDAKKNGNDGLIISNIRDGGFMPNNGTSSTHYVVFDPKQIKSAIGNNGNFDPKDPRITAGLAGLLAGGAAASPFGFAAAGQGQQ